VRNCQAAPRSCDARAFRIYSCTGVRQTVHSRLFFKSPAHPPHRNIPVFRHRNYTRRVCVTHVNDTCVCVTHHRRHGCITHVNVTCVCHTLKTRHVCVTQHSRRVCVTHVNEMCVCVPHNIRVVCVTHVNVDVCDTKFSPLNCYC